jgi:plasmid stabilization system protein ParE
MKKAYHVLLTKEARNEVVDAYEWYESKQPKLGGRFKRQLHRTFNDILANPSGFKIIFENQRQATIDKFPFVVVYEIFDKEILVFAVFHTSQNPLKKAR